MGLLQEKASLFEGVSPSSKEWHAERDGGSVERAHKETPASFQAGGFALFDFLFQRVKFRGVKKFAKGNL